MDFRGACSNKGLDKTAQRQFAEQIKKPKQLFSKLQLHVILLLFGGNGLGVEIKSPHLDR